MGILSERCMRSFEAITMPPVPVSGPCGCHTRRFPPPVDKRAASRCSSVVASDMISGAAVRLSADGRVNNAMGEYFVAMSKRINPFFLRYLCMPVWYQPLLKAQLMQANPRDLLFIRRWDSKTRLGKELLPHDVDSIITMYVLCCAGYKFVIQTK